MATNIEIDDKLINEALKLLQLKDKNELFNIALKELIRKYTQKDIRELKGKIKFLDDYDYKDMRKGYQK